jgi:hypothetical protein
LLLCLKELLIVDMQNDFCPGDALAVREGEKIIPVPKEIKENIYDEKEGYYYNNVQNK